MTYSKIFDDTKRRAVSLRQLSVLFLLSLWFQDFLMLWYFS